MILGKMSQSFSSAAVVIGALRVNAWLEKGLLIEKGLVKLK